MKLHLIRHAHAVTAEENPLRPLSVRGHQQVTQLVVHFRDNGALRPVEFWHSPLARSRETAELLATGLGLASPLTMIPGLEPENDPHFLFKRLSRVTHDLAIVGHEPHLSALASLLIHGPSAPNTFSFQKGGVLSLEKKNGGWLERAYVSPKMLGSGSG